MDANTNVVQKFQIRLKQPPIVDIWSTREKLCLASSVQRSGDQNWYSVSRSLKALGETNRPNDWYSQKNCALQYKDLLEKNESETPKRSKRGERGEEIAEDIIVRKLTTERIEELRKLVCTEKEKRKNIKNELELLKNDGTNKILLLTISKRMKDAEVAEKEDIISHKKWLEEREAKIAAMKTSSVNRQLKYSISAITKPAETSVDTPKTPKNEPLKVEVDNDNSVETANNAVIENKLSLPISSSPSTSPLLTSLLQSPTPSVSTPTLLSPNVPSILPSKDSVPYSRTPSVVAYTPIKSSENALTFEQKSISLAEKVASIPVQEKNDSVTNIFPSDSCVTNSDNISTAQSVNSQSSAPTLSKLLELPPSAPGILPPLPVIEAHDNQELELEAHKQKNEEHEEPSKEQISNTTDIIITPIKSPTKVSSIKKDDNLSIEDKQINETSDQITVDNSASVEQTINTLPESETQDITPAVISTINPSTPLMEIKQEIMEEEEEVEGRINIKEEPMDIPPSTPNVESKPSDSTINTTRIKRKKLMTSLPITPTATRRSGRVKALRDLKAPNDDSIEASDASSASNTPQPQAMKKRGSVDDNTTEASMSEESMDASKVNTMASLNESVPNSPASSTMQSEDAENIKEYKLWKKSIMLVWRTASTHKFASLFLHAVTDDDAEGYSDVVHRPIDLQTIRKRIESGIIRTTSEFQRDIMLMFQNAIMFNNANHDVHQMAVEMQKEIIESIEDFIETQQQSNQTNESKLRGRERRANATTATTLASEYELAGRRKSRGASSDTEPILSTPKSLKKKKIP